MSQHRIKLEVQTVPANKVKHIEVELGVPSVATARVNIDRELAGVWPDKVKVELVPGELRKMILLAKYVGTQGIVATQALKGDDWVDAGCEFVSEGYIYTVGPDL